MSIFDPISIPDMSISDPLSQPLPEQRGRDLGGAGDNGNSQISNGESLNGAGLGLAVPEELMFVDQSTSI